jgi:hypothetical protein
LSDAGRGAGDDDDLAVNGSLLQLPAWAADFNAATFYTKRLSVPGPADCRACKGLVKPRP